MTAIAWRKPFSDKGLRFDQSQRRRETATAVTPEHTGFPTWLGIPGKTRPYLILNRVAPHLFARQECEVLQAIGVFACEVRDAQEPKSPF